MARETEFGGKDTPAGIRARPSGALTASDKLRLGYRTGQEVDSLAPTSDRSWEGLAEPGESVVDK
jgi:hypothetical protein